ncbi:TraR/DksA C4-type zinc finger protein [Pseudomonas sp. GXZC]|uniref:TraR/DksA C4-type zinc finger protein n=1 Tax=Pseudomonas sp. GXZC TaxID=3003351 RepID=UPI0022AA722A|nr:TraR/DksA C4-type zinc finger protein [Pseudomonas sp. GXZC]WAT32232.1 TraR/DksA C4-type zinc finger protein [Pseudomonas sp. GXZC]
MQTQPSVVGTDADTVIITTEQLLGMPEDQYMSAPQLLFFESLLLHELDEARQRHSQARQTIQDRPAVSDVSDWASAEEERASALSHAERNHQLCRKIAKALERIHDESYGWCEVTGEPIGLKRLLSRPTTSLCIEEKQRQEAKELHHHKARGAA